MTENQVTIFKSPHDKEHPYVMVSREMAQDKNLSLKAKGLLLYLLSLPGDWQIYHSALMEAVSCGESCLNSALDELIEKGYARRERKRTSKGTYSPYKYEISELKRFLPNGIIQAGLSRPDNQDLQKKNNKTKEEGTFLPLLHPIFSQIPGITPEQQKTILDSYPLERIQETIDYVKSKPRQNEASYFMKMILIERKKENPDKDKILEFLKEKETQFKVKIVIFKSHCVLPEGEKVYFDLKGKEFRKRVSDFLAENFQSC